ncbi:hypothetical protein DSL72_001411 [Monilinia vaccinii-corymbosi]|uniref:Rhodopsin domain-containing protein n=1 Tax=Monilinia vaccinii-corymbosi TaxID=61207 RepID=A0A8A3P3U0_9HELO|nr:hypothetical protein DSL72_001411 [Monilinia vaccinii-corymbosi]
MATPFSPLALANLPHDNIQGQALAINFAFPALALAALALRLYSRSLTRSFAADDWVICFAMVAYWAETYTSYKVIIHYSVGYHVWDVSKQFDPVIAGKYAYANELIYNPILGLVKTSILLFLLRLTGQKTNVKRAIISLLTFNGLIMVVVFLLMAFHCIPVAANWHPEKYPNAACLNFQNFVTATGAISVITDVLTLLMPTWIVYNLQINRRQKVMLIGILSFGLITVIVGIVRIILLDRWDRSKPVDPTYTLLFCISTVEVGLSFVCACAPALKPIFVRIIPKIFGRTSRSQSAKKSTGDYGKGRRPEGYELSSGATTRDAKVIGAVNMPDQDHDRMSDIMDPKGASGIGEGMHKGRMAIAVRTDTEVIWHDNGPGSKGRSVVKQGSSTESLV